MIRSFRKKNKKHRSQDRDWHLIAIFPKNLPIWHLLRIIRSANQILRSPSFHLANSTDVCTMISRYHRVEQKKPHSQENMIDQIQLSKKIWCKPALLPKNTTPILIQRGTKNQNNKIRVQSHSKTIMQRMRMIVKNRSKKKGQVWATRI